MAAALAVSCTEKVNLGNGNNEGEGTKFSIEVSEIAGTSVSLVVKHDGTSKDTYDVFWYEGSSADVDNEINKEIVKIKNGEVSLQKGTNSETLASDLKGKTQYTAVVFGVDKDGNTYGQAASVEFTTGKAPVTLSLEVSDYGTDFIDIALTSSSNAEDDTWYAIITGDNTTPIKTQLENAAKAESNLASKLQVGSKTLHYDGLKPFSGYVIIAGCMDESGNVNGDAVSLIVFTAVEAVENPNWTVSYEYGHDYIYNSGATESHPNNVHVESTDGTRYAIGLFLKEDIETNGYTLDNICKGVASDVLYWIDYYMEATNYSFEEIRELLTYTESSYEAFSMYEAPYVAYAIQLDEDCLPTGKYAMVEFTPEAAKPEYSSWEGTWDFIGANKKSISGILMAGNYVNESYMFFYGGQTGVDYVGYANWDYKTNNFYIINFNFIDTIEMTLNSGGKVDCELYFTGIYNDGYIASNSERMCEAVPYGANSTTELNALEWTGKDDKGNAFTATCQTAVSILWGDLDGTGAAPYPTMSLSDCPTFPMSITRTADLPAAESKVMRSRKNIGQAEDVDTFVRNARVHSKREMSFKTAEMASRTKFARMSNRPMMVDMF